jgi:hypothetical protein
MMTVDEENQEGNTEGDKEKANEGIGEGLSEPLIAWFGIRYWRKHKIGKSELQDSEQSHT